MSQVFEDYNTKKCVIIIILSWILISYVAAFWGYTHGATKYMLLGLVITWMLIKIRLEENKKSQKNQFFTSQETRLDISSYLEENYTPPQPQSV